MRLRIHRRHPFARRMAFGVHRQLCMFAHFSSQNSHPARSALRIQEFDLKQASSKAVETTHIELWDISGNKQFEACWAAAAKDAHGAILVFDTSKQNPQELDIWVKQIVKEAGLRGSQCVIFANTTDAEDPQSSELSLSKVLSRVRLVRTNIAKSPDSVRDEFSDFVRALKSPEKGDD
eukprot:m.17055 g.17055  ORF g.17055 m.17055 type:complete len:178 (+) comp28788_c0_seq2:128-661(+)